MSTSLPPSRGRATAGEPAVAALLTWIVPGAGHLYLGRTVFALGAFAVVSGLYLLGLELSHWMGFELLHKELRSPFAPALAPEIGNLGGFLAQSRLHGFGPGYPRPWPDLMPLGVALTSLSGVLNLCLVVQAHLDARMPRPLAGRRIDLARSPAFACVLAWLVPGLGHLVQGRRLRAGLVFAALVGLLVLGTALAEGANLSRERHYYYWGGQFMAGLPALLLEALHGSRPVTKFVPYAEAGLVLGSIAGLLNILALLDVYGYWERRYLGLDEARAQGERGLEATT